MSAERYALGTLRAALDVADELNRYADMGVSIDVTAITHKAFQQLGFVTGLTMPDCATVYVLAVSLVQNSEKAAHLRARLTADGSASAFAFAGPAG